MTCSHFRSERRLFSTLRAGAISGRDGLGTVFVFAAGNEFEEGTDADYYGLTSTRFSMAIAAINGQGRAADYSSVGSSLLVSAFAEGDEPTRGQDRFNVVTTDQVGSLGYNPRFDGSNLTDPDYTGDFDGTSAAAPQVSGVVALMLQANPNLGYRDVQEILAYSALQNFPEQVQWQFNGANNWNGGGLHVNRNYGYGQVDAHGATRLAETWHLQSTAANETSLTSKQRFRQRDGQSVIPDDAQQPLEVTLPMADGLLINHVELSIQVRHTAIEDLSIVLVSPSGTESLVFDGVRVRRQSRIEVGNRLISFSKFRENPELALEDNDRALFRLGKFYQKGLDYTFTSTFHWGETSGGDWKVQVFDQGRLGEGRLSRVRVNLYGDPVTTSNTYIYTEEFARFTDAETTNRRVLSDTNGGIDTINAAALRSDMTLTLEAGQVSTLAGNTFQIAEGTVIEQAIAGDGKDTITGNAVDNQLRGGRNDDTLIGNGGNDILLGESQEDTLIGVGSEQGLGTIDQLTGGAGSDLFVLGDGAAVFYGTAAENGTGLDDYAVITDFSLDADRIQLSNDSSQYSLGVSPIASEPGAAIFLNRTIGTDLIAVIRDANPTALDLTSGYFSYVM